MSLPSHVQDEFTSQADACQRLGSPFTARLLTLAAARLTACGSVGEALAAWPISSVHDDALGLRLAGALHALVLCGADPVLAAAYPGAAAPAGADDEALWAAVSAALDRHGRDVAAMLASPPQTNEVARSAMLLPGLCVIARETGLTLDLLEIGASAGLNLLVDRYRIGIGEAWAGPSDSPVRLTPECRGATPRLDPIHIRERRGCDLRPVDITDPAARTRLSAYVWADQTARRQRLAAALEIAASAPPVLDRADAVDWLAQRLRTRAPGAMTVIQHSIVLQYLPTPAREALVALILGAGAAATLDAPLAWLRMEGVPGAGHAGLYLDLWPGGESRYLADCDYHGRWIAWRGKG